MKELTLSIGANLKSAAQKGIKTIQVDFKNTPEAIKQLKKLLGETPEAKL